MNPRDILPWIFGIIVFGVPAVALSVRIAARPLLEGLARLREASHPVAPAAPDARVDALQAEMSTLRERVDRLAAVEEFYAQLQAPAGGAAASSGAARPPLPRG